MLLIAGSQVSDEIECSFCSPTNSFTYNPVLDDSVYTEEETQEDVYGGEYTEESSKPCENQSRISKELFPEVSE